MTAIRRRFVDVGAGQGHLRQVGSPGERPAVVLLHHAPSSSVCWDPVLPLLAQAGLAAFALDLPGFGQSSPARWAPDLGWYADWVRDVLDALELTEPVTVVGRHSGATVAAALAAIHPERVGAVLMWGYPWLSDAVMHELATEITPALGDDLAPLHQMVDVLRVLDPLPTSDAEQRRRLGDLLIAGADQHWLHNAIGRTDHGRLAGQIAAPSLFVFDDGRPDLADQHAAGRRSADAAVRGEFRSVAGLSSGAVDLGAAELADLVADLAHGRLVPGGSA